VSWPVVFEFASFQRLHVLIHCCWNNSAAEFVCVAYAWALDRGLGCLAEPEGRRTEATTVGAMRRRRFSLTLLLHHPRGDALAPQFT
jgi:hypothetical protein